MSGRFWDRVILPLRRNPPCGVAPTDGRRRGFHRGAVHQQRRQPAVGVSREFSLESLISMKNICECKRPHGSAPGASGFTHRQKAPGSFFSGCLMRSLARRAGGSAAGRRDRFPYQEGINRRPLEWHQLSRTATIGRCRWKVSMSRRFVQPSDVLRADWCQ
ncbi:hypothetical protein BV133_2270 [Blastochloris viridis]|uniref:Uncharacterized protein n=1 Tax=Blastochloris viridis TaxID=1079 RepID=A0A182D3W8_BLAVI|nr:hypothetical protein BV133_2270 [Blastochloris viridis]